MQADRPRIAIVTFTDMRDEGISNDAVERHLRTRQEELAGFLSSHGIEAVDPLRELRAGGSPWYGVRSFAEIDALIRILGSAPVDGAIIGSWTWSPPMLVKEFVRKLARPILYYTENDPMAGSLSQMSATCASLMEWSVNRYALLHERCFGNRTALLAWARGVHAAAVMRESAALLWGGTYAVKMEQLQDDIPRLKSFMIRDILSEDQYVLIRRAEEIIRSQPGQDHGAVRLDGEKRPPDPARRAHGHRAGPGQAGGAAARGPGQAGRARAREHPRGLGEVPARDLRGVRRQRLLPARPAAVRGERAGQPVCLPHRVRRGYQGASHLDALPRHHTRGAPGIRGPRVRRG